MVHLLDFHAGEPNQGVAALVRSACGLGEVRITSIREGAPCPPDEGVWILSGGPGSPLEPGAWRAPLFERLRARVQGRRPTLAVCYGFEILAAALGAELRRLTTPRLGVWPVQPERADPVLRGCGGAGTFENRHWGVFGALGEPLAFGPEGDLVAARFGPGVVGAIFHPEADDAAVLPLLRGPLRAELVARYGASAPEAMARMGVQRIHEQFFAAWLAEVATPARGAHAAAGAA